MGKLRPNISLSQSRTARKGQSWSWILAYRSWALSTAPASPDTALLPQERRKLAGDGGRGQHMLYSPDNAAPCIVCWRTSKFYQFALQILCRSFPLCISSNCYTLAHPFPGMTWLWEMKQMLSSWDTFGNSCFAYLQPCSLFWSSGKHILISAKSILIFTGAPPA